jgi:hypothetical protein
VQGVATAAVQITELRGRHDEGEETLVAHQRAHRVNARPAIKADGGQEPQSNADVVEQRSPFLGHCRLGVAELDSAP